MMITVVIDQNGSIQSSDHWISVATSLLMCYDDNRIICNANEYNKCIEDPELQHVIIIKLKQVGDNGETFPNTPLDGILFIVNDSAKFTIEDYNFSNYEELLYRALCYKILQMPLRSNRTGIDTRSSFHETLRFNLHTNGRKIIPLLTSKKTNWVAIYHELIWFLRGSTNIKYLTDNNIHIWDANATKEFLLKNGLDYGEGHVGPCFPGDTLVQTLQGNVQIKDVCIGDQVLTHRGNWFKVSQLHNREYKSILFEVGNPIGPSVFATPEHPFLARQLGDIEPTWIAAKDITINHYVAVRISYDEITPEIDTDWEKLGKAIRDIDLFDGDIRNPLIKMFIADNSPDPNSASTRIKKHLIIPLWLEMAPVEIIRSFLRGFHTSGSCFFVQTMELALQIQRLYFKLRVVSRIEQYEGNSNNILISLTNEQNVLFDRDFVWIKVNSIDTKIFNGNVYNLTVDTDNTYTVNNLVVHNCYGSQWRSWGGFDKIEGIDQITNVIDQIKNDPWSRRHVVSAWNVSDLNKMALPPCHYSFQFVVEGDEKPTKLNCLVNMRSADLPLGVPFNIASYALLTHFIAHLTNLTPGELSLSMADCHIYTNQEKAVLKMLDRYPRRWPKLEFSEKVKKYTKIDQFAFDSTIDDFSIINYNPHPFIKIPMAV